jgi:hypothetical protein
MSGLPELIVRGKRSGGRHVVDYLSDWSRIGELIDAGMVVAEQDGDETIYVIPPAKLPDATDAAVRRTVLDAVEKAYGPDKGGS